MKRFALVCASAVLLTNLVLGDFKSGLEAYERGDYAAALREWQPLAEKGDANAQYNLGLFYNQGQGVPKDLAQATAWYRKAAEQGNSNAEYNLAVMYSTGQGVPRDDGEAMKWYLKAAEKGVAGAQNNLGALYDEGSGAFRDFAQAEKWYRKAAEQGIATSQFNLAVMYDIGQGVPVNYEEALAWYHKAADQGHAGALGNIGILYYNGQGVKRDLTEAMRYFTLAAQAGDPRAQELTRSTSAKLKKKEIERAQELAAEWRTAHPLKPRTGTQVASAAPAPVAGTETAAASINAGAPATSTEAASQGAAESRSRSGGAQESGPGIWSGVERVVAVGDVHGDYPQLVAVLRSANLIDEENNWTGGKAHLVQTGDVLDRGPESRKALDVLMRLESQAAAAGGAVHLLIGNHEAMNVYGDLRYVSPGEYEAFRDENSAAVRDAAYKKDGNGQDRARWDAQHPLGYFEHRQQLSSSGTYGKWIASRDAVIKINDTLFLHAGVSPKYASAKIREINQRVRDELRNPEKLNGGIVTDVEGPLWYRGMAHGDPSFEPQVQKVLKNFGVERIVIGHTYADAAITPRFGGKVVLIDIGLSRVYDNIGKEGCLVIENGKAYALHRGTRLELPTDSGKDMLRYLKQAAALDPPPSPLLKRISELEAKGGADGGE
jgi:TPR repeat protein